MEKGEYINVEWNGERRMENGEWRIENVGVMTTGNKAGNNDRVLCGVPPAHMALSRELSPHYASLGNCVPSLR